MHPTLDNRGQIHLLPETVAMLFVGQEIDRQSQPTPRQHRYKPLVAKGTDQTVKGHGGNMADHGTPLQAETPIGGQQGITSHLRSHLAIAQDKMREDREHGFAPRTLDTPDGHPTEADSDVMGVACQAPASATGRLVCELKAEGEDESEHEFNKGLAVAKQAHGSEVWQRFVGEWATSSEVLIFTM